MPVDHYENFPVASWILPKSLRAPVEAIYRFARSADDIADEGEACAESRLAALDAYRAELQAIAAQHPGAPGMEPVFAPLRRAVLAHDLPLGLLHDLLDAFAQDVRKCRYADYRELLDYCRRSANPVGRLLLRLYRAPGADNERAADCICSALQIINFCQDVAADWRKGRVYLPQDELARFGVAESQIAAGHVDANWSALMRFQVNRARDLMHAGAQLARRLPGRVGLELRLVVAGGLRVAERIDAVRGDVFARRPRLGAVDAPVLLWRALSLGRSPSAAPLPAALP